MRELITMMGYEDASWGAAEWVAMSLMMLLFWGLLIGFAVWAARRFRAGGESVLAPDGNGRAEEILSERFARGDMDEVELERRRGLLHAPEK